MLKKSLVTTICALSVVAGLSTATVFTLQLSGAINIFSDKAHIEFRNYDNTLLYKTDIPVGTYAVYEGAQPTKQSTEMYDYTFTTWDKPLNNIVKDTVFYAQFQNHPKEFKVTFQNYNFSVLYVTNVARGETAHFIGAAPTRKNDEKNSYTFAGWDKPTTNIQEDTVFTAQYDETPVDYQVTFKNYDGTLLYTTYVAYGESAQYKGIEPKKEGTNKIDYVFTGWSDSIEFITEDTEVYAEFKQVPVTFEVTFVNYNQTLLYKDYVAYGGKAEYFGNPPAREPDDNWVYIFNGWDKDLTNIVEDRIITAQYRKEERVYTVKFYNYDDELLYTQSVKYGHSAFYNGITPTRPMDDKYVYTFTNEWDRDLSFITEDTITYVEYQKTLREFRCIFLNYDGTPLCNPISVQYGKTAVYPGKTPVKDIDMSTSWRFIGWDKDTKNITSDTTFIAQFEKYSEQGGGGGSAIAVKFMNYGNEAIDFDVINIGEVAEYLEDEELLERPDSTYFNNCHFEGWSCSLEGLEKNTIIFPLYTCDEGVIIQYRNYKGKLIYEEAVSKGGITSYKGEQSAIQFAGMQFIGWQDQVGNYFTNSFQVYEPHVFIATYDF